MDAAKLQSIKIEAGQRRRSGGIFWTITGSVIVITTIALLAAKPWAKDERTEANSPTHESKSSVALPQSATKPTPQPGNTALTVSGYIINRERIEISPRTMNVVKWIGVKKGDFVKKDQVVVQLDDSEQKARLMELDGQLAMAQVSLERAEVNYRRVQKLRATQNESAEKEDETRLNVESAKAQISQLEGSKAIAQVWLDWTVIKSPVDGVVLEKLADPGELVTPQSFGGGTGPSTALLALADPSDMQVEIDINEGDLPKVSLNQPCKISPEAYPDKIYEGTVAEIAPEANRQKGTLQVKVQIKNPDHFLTPELSAKVEFLQVNSSVSAVVNSSK